MNQVSTITAFLSNFFSCLTAPTADNLMVLFRGALLANGRRTVTGCISAAWFSVTKHWTVYENLIRRARIGMLNLSRTLLRTAIGMVPKKQPVIFIIDESLVRRYGPYVTGIGMHRDAVRSSRSNLITTPGHKWVILAVALHLPFCNHVLALPVLSLLYTTRKQPKRNHAVRPYRKHRTVNDLAIIMLKIVTRWLKNRRFNLIGDGAYGTHELADLLNPLSRHSRLKNGILISRFRMDGVTYGQAPKYCGVGRPKKKGDRLLTPAESARLKKTKWQTCKVNWYGGTRKKVMLCSHTGLWYKCGFLPTPIRWVLVKDADGTKPNEVFFSTDTHLAEREIVERYVMRWSLETTFQETREHLGLETMRNRNIQSIKRSVPMLLSLYSIIVLWFAKHHRKPEAAIRSMPWYRKDFVTFSDMFMAARRDIMSEVFFHASALNTGEFLFPFPVKRDKLRAKPPRKRIA